VELVVEPGAKDAVGEMGAREGLPASYRGDRWADRWLLSEPQRRARYESIHKAVQYKNSGVIQIAIMSDGITMYFQCSRTAAPRKGDVRETSDSKPQKVRPLHESIVKVLQRVSAFCDLTEDLH
jgi:hypothetical protein